MNSVYDHNFDMQQNGCFFLITESLMNTIQNKRLYRVYAIDEGGAWRPLSIEALD